VADRRWGWHPLLESWAQRIVDSAQVRSGELVLDLGAGHGALTRCLVRAGARVVAVELHPRRCALLRSRFAGDPVEVVEADLRCLRPPHRPFRVVANPPYHLTTDLLHLLLGRDTALVAADLVLQRAAVRELVAGRGPAWWRRRWRLSEGMPLPRSAFASPPTVDSRVLVIRRR
jgi:23S rRNA (adenine-N6)-dimethyltransferase